MNDLINGIFLWVLDKHQIKKNQGDMEHLTLKYISFLYQFYGNSPKAYFQIKQYLSKNQKKSSSYFKMVSQVICKAIENTLDHRLEQSKESSDQNQSFIQRNQELTVYTVIQIDQVCSRFIPLIIDCIQNKVNFWQNMLKGYNTMDNFQIRSLGLAENIQRLSKQFHFKLRQIDNFVQQYDSYQLKKLKMLFYLIVLNDTIKAQKLDEEGDDIKNRDMLKSVDIIHSSNFIKGNIQTIIISLSQRIGKIVSKRDQKFMEFFGYDKEEAGSIEKINDLMPLYISRLHDQFLMHYVQRGSSQLIQNNFFSFIQTKEGFIQQAKIYIDYIFTTADDFQMAGNILKINSAYDFMIFNRKGLVVGVTQNLISMLFSEVKKVPKISQILHKYYAFIFFKEILKIFKQKREEIKKTLSQDEMNVQLEKTSKGWLNLSESFEQVMTQFTHYIDYCQKNSKDIKNTIDISQIDILSEQTLDFFEQFQAFKLLRKNIGSNQNLSSQDLKSRFGYSKDSKSLKLYQTRLFFKYSLHLSQFDLNKQERDSNKEAYFILKFHDLTINKKPIGKKMEFTKSMITYLGATTSIGLLSQFGSQLSRLQTLNQNSFKDFQSIKLTMNTSSCSSKFKDIPIRMINSLVRMKSQNQNGLNQIETENQPQEKSNNAVSIFSNKMLENIKSKRQQIKQNIDTPRGQQKDNLNENQRDNHEGNMSSQNESDQDQDESASDEYQNDNQQIQEVISSEEEEEEGDKEQKLKSLLGQINMHEEFHKSQAKSQNHQILNKFKMTENYIKSIDPNYHIKKVLQHNSKLSQFSIALENAILEAQMEMMQEQRILEKVKSIIEVKESSSDPIVLNKNSSNDRIDTTQIFDQFSKQKIESRSSLTIDDSHRLFQQQSNQSKKNYFEYASKDSIIQNASGGKDSPSLFKKISADLSPIPKQKENPIIQNRKSQFTYYQEASNDTTLYSFIHNNQQENSISNVDHTQKPVFQNPNELAYTFNDYTQQINTPSLGSNNDIGEEQKEQVPKNIFLKNFQNIPRKQKQNEDEQTIDESSQKDNYNFDFKFQKSIDQQEDIDRQLEEIKSQKKKRQKDKIILKQQMSLKSTRKTIYSNQDRKNVQINLLLQKGLKKDENIKEMFEGSVKSNSSSTRTRYGGIFLREILSSNRLPITAQYYKAILFFFFVSFAVLNIISLNVISTTMNSFSAYIAIIRVPRQFQRQYSIALMGKYAQQQINLGYLKDDSNNTLLNMSQTYISRSFTAYNQQYVNNSQIVTESWEEIKNSDFYYETYTFFKNHQPQQQQLILNMIYENEQAEIEINKLAIIKQLINTDLWDWLKYNYNGILWMRYEQFDLNGVHRNQKDLYFILPLSYTILILKIQY
ncbi:transmembrane protein, putative (macronuclear) [Tetrahymena thermophila SB210]|uniref:Transmembrane protein, putative n=1 Tax=Tetrahymena thermophila (strain SB210) TaxID=312017 RepID=Q22XV8_TETTS|nr:transmembrane protein, putative [Tetrahymena thermophila SB210]EAR90266.2 transmembrane protein, putative [Tetrahymena thermophila SB210]|eukprot:XP_001010511.2 transmembrane protein, putative [Tetrahymena thermophila SB210]